jgi:hypothetical protein
MKAKALFLSLTLAAGAFAGQDSVKLERSYKVDDVDTYRFQMKMTGAMGDIGVSMNMTQTVKKVYENGDADIETLVKDMKVSVMGQEFTPPTGPAEVARYTRSGVPATASRGGPGPGMDFMRYAWMMAGRELKVGETIPINVEPTAESKTRVGGTVKLESIANGVATVISALEVAPEGATKPLRMNTTAQMDVATMKPNRIEGKATDLPSMGGQMPEIQSMEFIMERVR